MVSVTIRVRLSFSVLDGVQIPPWEGAIFWGESDVPL